MFYDHSWLNCADEDDDEDEVGLKEKPEDIRYINKIRVLHNSPLYDQGARLCGPNHLIGDGAYPIEEWLLTPYRDNGHLSHKKKHYINSFVCIHIQSYGTLVFQISFRNVCNICCERDRTSFVVPCGHTHCTICAVEQECSYDIQVLNSRLLTFQLYREKHIIYTQCLGRRLDI